CCGREYHQRYSRTAPASVGVVQDRRVCSGGGRVAAVAGDPGRAPARVKPALRACHRRPGADNSRGGTSMSIALEIAAGMVLTTALVAGMTILAALELGRMVSMDDAQREVEATPVEPPTLRYAA